MQPVEDPPFGQRDDGVRLAARVVLQRPERVYCNEASTRITRRVLATTDSVIPHNPFGAPQTRRIRKTRTQTGRRDSLNRSYCCSKDMTRGGSRPRRPRRSRSVMGNAVSCAQTEWEAPGKLKPHRIRAQPRDRGCRLPTLLYHGSWRMSLPRLCTMQGPGTAAPAGAGGADDDRRRRTCDDRRAADRHIAGEIICHDARSGGPNPMLGRRCRSAAASDTVRCGAVLVAEAP